MEVQYLAQLDNILPKKVNSWEKVVLCSAQHGWEKYKYLLALSSPRSYLSESIMHHKYSCTKIKFRRGWSCLKTSKQPLTSEDHLLEKKSSDWTFCETKEVWQTDFMQQHCEKICLKLFGKHSNAPPLNKKEMFFFLLFLALFKT